jgi:hypothetical protein
LHYGFNRQTQRGSAADYLGPRHSAGNGNDIDHIILVIKLAHLTQDLKLAAAVLTLISCVQTVFEGFAFVTWMASFLSAFKNVSNA